jgi:hypothetical protein
VFKWWFGCRPVRPGRREWCIVLMFDGCGETGGQPRFNAPSYSRVRLHLIELRNVGGDGLLEIRRYSGEHAPFGSEMIRMGSGECLEVQEDCGQVRDRKEAEDAGREACEQ